MNHQSATKGYALNEGAVLRGHVSDLQGSTSAPLPSDVSGDVPRELDSLNAEITENMRLIGVLRQRLGAVLMDEPSDGSDGKAEQPALTMLGRDIRGARYAIAQTNASVASILSRLGLP